MIFQVDQNAWYVVAVRDANGPVPGLTAVDFANMVFNKHVQGGTTTQPFTPTDGVANYQVLPINNGKYRFLIPGSGGTANNDTKGTCWIDGTPSSGEIMIFPAEVTDNTFALIFEAFLGRLSAAGRIQADTIESEAFTSAKFQAGAIAAGIISSAARSEIADRVLTRDWNSIVEVPGARSLWNAARSLRNKVLRSAGQVTVFEEDDATIAWSGAIVATPDIDPITEIDPS